MTEPTPTHYDMVGGRAVVVALAEAFYDAMERDEPALTAVHETDPAGRITRATRERFAKFLVFWLGGPDDYMRDHGHPRLRMRHAHVPIDSELRDAWLRAMTSAMEAVGLEPEVQAMLGRAFAPVADFLRNRPDSR